MDPSFADLAALLVAANAAAATRYAHITSLVDELQYRFALGMAEVQEQQRDPTALLHLHLRGERAVLNAWNKHRLGAAVYWMSNAPHGAYDYNPAENMPEALETFPLRREALSRGYSIPAIKPIYQDIEQLPLRPALGTIYDKLASAPPPTLAFPAANITLVELATFLPQSLKAWPVIDRLVGAGATAHLLARAINAHRAMHDGEVAANTVYRMMRGAMDKRARLDTRWAGWSVRRHAGIAHAIDSASCNSSPSPSPNPGPGISTAGFHSLTEPSVAEVRFTDLARGVGIWPAGADALDLTRCVQYCVQYHAEPYMYPTDMPFVLSLLGEAGPAVVRAEHGDQAALARLQQGKRECSGEVSRLGTGKRRREGGEMAQRVSASHHRRHHSSAVEEEEEEEEGKVVRFSDTDSSDSDSDAYHGPKRMRLPKGLPQRTSGRTRRIEGAYREVDESK